MKNKLSTRIIVEAGILIALATILSFIKIYKAPYGGSVTAASMVPLIIFALRWGPRPGILAGVAYGLVQMMVEPFIIHPIQALLDYAVAFGLLGLAGFAQNRPPLGAAMGIAGRFVAHFLSGVVFFASYAPEGSPVALYSLLYNGSYLLPEVIISAVVVSLISVARVLNTGQGQTA